MNGTPHRASRHHEGLRQRGRELSSPAGIHLLTAIWSLRWGRAVRENRPDESSRLPRCSHRRSDHQDIEVEKLDSDQRSLLRRHALDFIFQGSTCSPAQVPLNVELPMIYRASALNASASPPKPLAAVGLPTKTLHTRPNSPVGSSSGSPSRDRHLALHTVRRRTDRQPRFQNLRGHHGSLFWSNTERGITVLLVTHEDHVASFARRTIHVRDGLIASVRISLHHAGKRLPYRSRQSPQLYAPFSPCSV